MRSFITIILAVLTSCLMAGCETIFSAADKQEQVYSHPDLTDPKALSCEDLNALAGEAINGEEAQFFVSQLTNPGDWRIYSESADTSYFVKNNSRQRIRKNDVDWSEMQILVFDKSAKRPEVHKVQIPVEMCTKPPESNIVQMTVSNVRTEKGTTNKIEDVNLTGKEPKDILGRIICGIQDYPEITGWEAASQRWKRCQADGRKQARLVPRAP